MIAYRHRMKNGGNDKRQQVSWYKKENIAMRHNLEHANILQRFQNSRNIL